MTSVRRARITESMWKCISIAMPPPPQLPLPARPHQVRRSATQHMYGRRDEMDEEQQAFSRLSLSLSLSSLSLSLSLSLFLSLSLSACLCLIVPPSELIAQLVHDRPRAASPAPPASAVGGSSSLPTRPASGSTSLPSVAARARRSLTRHQEQLPSTIAVADFGSYLRFLNRSDQCDALVQHLQSRYDSLFLPRAQQPPNARGRPDDYLKHLQVAYSAGAPGIGKTTWARMALDHFSDRVHLSASFEPVLGGASAKDGDTGSATAPTGRRPPTRSCSTRRCRLRHGGCGST